MFDRPGPMSAPFRAGVFQVMTRVAQPVSGFIQFTGNVPLLPLSRFGQYTGSRYQNHQRKQQGSDSHNFLLTNSIAAGYHDQELWTVEILCRKTVLLAPPLSILVRCPRSAGHTDVS